MVTGIWPPKAHVFRAASKKIGFGGICRINFQNWANKQIVFVGKMR